MVTPERNQMSVTFQEGSDSTGTSATVAYKWATPVPLLRCTLEVTQPAAFRQDCIMGWLETPLRS